MKMRNSFPFEWLCTRTRHETEAYSNSEIGYLNGGGTFHDVFHKVIACDIVLTRIFSAHRII